MTESIALCFDANYVQPAATAIYTLAKHWKGRTAPVLDLVHGADLNPDQMTWLHQLCDALGVKAEYTTVDEKATTVLNALPVRFAHMSPFAWAKILLPKLLPMRRRILCVDCDVLIQADLSTLLAAPVPDDCVFSAVRDFGVPQLGTPFLGDDRLSVRDTDRDLPYFNSGVMLIDVPRWEAQSLTERAIEVAGESDNPNWMLFSEQDALNSVVHGKFELLDPRWNVALMDMLPRVLEFEYMGGPFYPPGYLQFLIKNARIVHFVTAVKPWTERFPPDDVHGHRWRTASKSASRLAAMALAPEGD